MIRAMHTKKMTVADWQKVRDMGLGGSDMGKVLGVSSWGTPVDVWLEKTGRRPRQPDNIAMWIGRELENSVAMRYAQQRDVVIRRYNYMLVDDVHHMIGNIDRLVTSHGTAAAVQNRIITGMGLECKTSAQEPWEVLPETYQAQVHTYMALAEVIEAFDVAVVFIGRAKGETVFTERYDSDIVAYIRAQAKEFWERYVLADVPPPPQNEDDCRAVWARSNRTVVQVSENIMARVGALAHTMERIKELEAEAGEHRTKIMEYMGENDALVDQQKTVATWRTSKDRQRTNWQAIAMELEAPQAMVNNHTTTTQGARVFRLS